MVLVETVGVGQSEVEVARLADTTVVLLAPGMGDAIQAAKAGILEVGDVYVVNKADRDGADAAVRELRHMLTLGERRGPGDWRPPDRARRSPPAARASTRWWRRWTSTAAGSRRPVRCTSGACTGRPTRCRRSPSRRCGRGSGDLRARGGEQGLDALAADVVAGRTDPYAAADRLLDGLTGS